MLKLINSYNLNRKILFFWFFIGAIIFFGSFFVIYNSVLAADDNANQVGCRSDIDYCDADYGSCVDVYHYQWTSNGYPSGAGNKNCCGDDSSEYFASCTVDDVGATCSGASACCDRGNSFGGRFNCVYNGVCYNSQQTVDTADSSADQEVCLLTTSSRTSWADPDSGSEDQSTAFNACTGLGYTWFNNASSCGNTGPGGVCDDYDGGGAFCCGDDNEENLIGDSVYYPWGGSSTEIPPGACCNNNNYCADKNGNCVSDESYADAGEASSVDLERCIVQSGRQGYWVDQDGGRSICQHIWANGPCVNAGPFGKCDDYDFGTDYVVRFCCGDDPNEKSVPSCSGTADAACCPTSASYY